MHKAEWLLLIGTVALLVGPLAALRAASKIRDYREKRKEKDGNSKQRDD
jgi:hypothetical protein